MNNRFYIGLVGLKQSGKTTAFKVIKSAIPDATEVMLADRLKEACSKATGIERKFFELQEYKEVPFVPELELSEEILSTIAQVFEIESSHPEFANHLGKLMKSPRHMLQYVGTDILRQIDDEIHLKTAEMNSKGDGVFVVTDIRFPNEFEYFMKKPLLLPIFVRRDELLSGVIVDQLPASERYVVELGKRCIEANNNGSMDQFRALITSILDANKNLTNFVKSA